MPASPTYASFLVRLWREGDSERGTPAAAWQGEALHIQTSQRRAFSNLDELLKLLRQATEESDAPRRAPDPSNDSGDANSPPGDFRYQFSNG